MKDFNDKVVVLTGAGSGIGRALALKLAGEGARLALSDINRPALDETLGLLPAGHRARGYAVDVSSREAVFGHADEVQRDFGVVHMVVNNAGATVVGTFEHLTIEEIEWQLNVNLWSVIYGTKAFLPNMLARREGVIVNISSVFGFMTFPCQSAYNMAKFGVRGLNECLWRELEDTGVKVVSVHPGGIATNVEKAGRRSVNATAVEDQVSVMARKALRTPPEVMAAAIVDGVKRGRKRIVAGHMSGVMFWLPRLFPNSYHRVVKALGY